MPGVVRVFVGVAEPLADLEGLRDRRRPVLVELVGQRQQQHHQRLVVLRIDLQRVEADALGLDRLLEQPIPLGLRERP